MTTARSPTRRKTATKIEQQCEHTGISSNHRMDMHHDKIVTTYFPHLLGEVHHQPRGGKAWSRIYCKDDERRRREFSLYEINKSQVCNVLSALATDQVRNETESRVYEISTFIVKRCTSST